MTQMILIRDYTTLTMVRETCEKDTFATLRSPQTLPLSLSRIGITSFRRKLPWPRKFGGFCGKLRQKNDFFCSVFNSTLINGLGRYDGGPPVPLAVVNVVKGLRLVLLFSSVWIYFLTSRATLATDFAWFPSPATLALSSPLIATL